jgi:hypothetical protein
VPATAAGACTGGLARHKRPREKNKNAFHRVVKQGRVAGFRWGAGRGMVSAHAASRFELAQSQAKSSSGRRHACLIDLMLLCMPWLSQKGPDGFSDSRGIENGQAR